MIKPDRAAIATYVNMLFGGSSEGTVAVRRYPEKDDTRDDRRSYNYTPFFTADAELADKVVAEADKAAALRVALYVIPCTTKGRGCAKKEDMVGTEVVTADLDTGDVAAKYQYLVKYLGQPTAEVCSGGLTETGQPRLHPYWRLSKPAVGEDFTKAMAIRAAIASKVGGDPALAKPAQPIRIAGSVHFKGGFAKPVELKAYRPGLEYRLGDMVEAVENMPAMPGLPPQAVGNGELVVKPLSYVLSHRVSHREERKNMIPSLSWVIGVEANRGKILDIRELSLLN